MKNLLITGTDTDVGKTILTITLTAYQQKYHGDRRFALMKLMQTGVGDYELYRELFDLKQTDEEVTPLRFTAPLAPPVAAEKEGRVVDLKKVWQNIINLQSRSDFLLIEALGGLGTPVTNELIVADLARDWRLPTILVAPVKLGAIAQIVANVALAQANKVNLLGIVLNCLIPEAENTINDLTPINLIESLTQVPVLGTMPYLPDFKDLNKLATNASQLDLEKFFL